MGSLTSQVSLCPVQHILAPTTETVSERLGDGATSGRNRNSCNSVACLAHPRCSPCQGGHACSIRSFSSQDSEVSAGSTGRSHQSWEQQGPRATPFQLFPMDYLIPDLGGTSPANVPCFEKKRETNRCGGLNVYCSPKDKGQGRLVYDQLQVCPRHSANS